MENKRYVLEEGSLSHHCCFEYSVVDTQNKEEKCMCECMSKENAEFIANALNTYHKICSAANRYRTPERLDTNGDTDGK
jgi:hypothetical protein